MELENQKHENFCKLFVFDPDLNGNISGCMKKVGFKESYAQSSGSGFIKRPKIAARIEEFREIERKHSDKDLNKRQYSAKGLIDDIELAKNLAIERKNPKEILDCVKLKANLLGLMDNPSKVKDDLGIAEKDATVASENTEGFLSSRFN